MKMKTVWLISLGALLLIMAGILFAVGVHEVPIEDQLKYGETYVGIVLHKNEEEGRFTLQTEAGYLHTFYFFEHTRWDMVSDFSVGDKVKVTTIHRKNEITYNVFILGIVKE